MLIDVPTMSNKRIKNYVASTVQPNYNWWCLKCTSSINMSCHFRLGPWELVLGLEAGSSRLAGGGTHRWEDEASLKSKSFFESFFLSHFT